MRHASTALILLFLAFLALPACSGDQASSSKGDGLKGWESGGEYDKKYDPAEFDKIKGFYDRVIDVTPLPGMAPGLALVMKDKADGNEVVVQLGPKSFVEEDLKKLDLRGGLQIKAYGAWAEIDGHDVIMATKIKKTEEAFIKVRRTKDGFPHWNLTLEERKKEIDGE